MATDMQRLIVSLEARTKQFDNALAKANGTADRRARAIESRFARMNKSISGSFNSLGRAMAGAFAAAASLRGAQQLIDSATRIENSLKVAGLAGDELNRVYDRLFVSATKNAAPLESLVTLYGRAALVQKELGVSTEELLGFTNNVALALRVAGSDAQSASGALLQLSQALGSGVVRAEEFNSILEGAPTILQATAAGLKEAEGSVSKLRQIMLAGELSSEAFFRAFEAGAPILEKKVANSVFTIGQRLENLRTSLTDAAKRFNESTAAAETFGTAIDNTAAFINSINFDTLIGEIGKVISQFNDGADAARDFALWIGRASGLDNVGAAITGGTGRREFLGGALSVTSSKGIQNRIDDAFGNAVEAAGDLTEDAIRRAHGAATSGGKTGRLPMSPRVTPVSLSDFAAPVDTSGGGASSRAAKKLADAATKESERLNEAIANQTAIAVDAATMLLGQNEKTNRGNINAFLKRGGVDLDAATTAWCAAFVNSALAQVGIQGSGSNVATDFLNWGVKIDPSKIQKGDVLVDPNGRSVGQTGGHVGFATGQMRATAEGISQIEMLSGNASNKVMTQWVDASEVVARRAADAFQVPTDALSHLTKESESAKLAADQLAASYEAWGQVAQTAMNGLANALADGKIEGKELLQILFQVAQQLLSMPSTGGAGGGGFLGSLLGGIGSIFGFKDGGIAAHGKPLKRFAGGGISRSAAIFGEAGPEAAVPLPDGRRIPVDLRGPQGGRGGQETVNIVLQDDSGRMAEIADQQIQTRSGTIVRVAVQESQKATRKNMPGYMADAQARSL